MFNWVGSSPTLMNCAFIGNHARTNGAAIQNTTAHPTLINCTISDNLSEVEGAGVHNLASSNPTIVNTILWGNSDPGGTDESAQIENNDSLGQNNTTIDYSCVQGWTGSLGGTGNCGPPFEMMT